MKGENSNYLEGLRNVFSLGKLDKTTKIKFGLLGFYILKLYILLLLHTYT